MQQRSALLIIASVLALASTAARAQGNCDYPLGPLAAKKSVALAIFNAIANGIESPAKRAKYDIEIRDERDSWSIFELLKGSYSVRFFAGANGVRMEEVHNTLGGGGLGMSINKCRATVSDVFYQR
jgi:hypothetical protein